MYCDKISCSRIVSSIAPEWCRRWMRGLEVFRGGHFDCHLCSEGGMSSLEGETGDWRTVRNRTRDGSWWNNTKKALQIDRKLSQIDLRPLEGQKGSSLQLFTAVHYSCLESGLNTCYQSISTDETREEYLSSRIISTHTSRFHKQKLTSVWRSPNWAIETMIEFRLNR